MQDKMQVRENVPRVGKRQEGLCGEKAVKSFYIEITKETKKGATLMEYAAHSIG